MSATSIGDCPTSSTVGLSTVLTTYPDGNAVRIPMMSFSRLSNDPALLFEATTAVMAKFSLTFVEALPIKTTSMYGVDGTMTIAGGIGDSGTLEKTLAANPLKAVDKAARVSAIELAGIIDKLFLRQDTVEAMKTPYLSMIYPCGTAYFENQRPGFRHLRQRGFGKLRR